MANINSFSIVSVSFSLINLIVFKNTVGGRDVKTYSLCSDQGFTHSL